MTKHNLGDHLAWLLHRGPSLYPSLGLLGNASNGSPRPDQVPPRISPNPEVSTSAASDSSSIAPASRSHVAPTAIPNIDHTHISQGDGIAVTSDNNMARLQFAPQSTSKPRMLSRVNGTPTPRTPTTSAQQGSQGSHGRTNSWKQAEGQLPPAHEPARKTPSHQETGYVNPRSPLADIDSIDLTGDVDDQDSSSATVEAFGESRLIWREDSASRAEPLVKRGKKRKSDEYTSDLQSPGKLGPRVNPLHTRLGSEDFDDFVAIDDFDDDLEFQDARTGETPSSGENKAQDHERQLQGRTIRDSEDEDEDMYDMDDGCGMAIHDVGADPLGGIEINNELYPKLSNREATERWDGSNRPTSSEDDNKIESRNTFKPALSRTPLSRRSPIEDATKSQQQKEPYQKPPPEEGKKSAFPISQGTLDRLQKREHEYAEEVKHNAEIAYEKLMEGLNPPPPLIHRNKILKSKISAIELLRSEKKEYDSCFSKKEELKKKLIEGLSNGDHTMANSEDMDESRKLAEELQNRVGTARELLERIGPLDFVDGEITQTPPQHTLVAGTQMPALSSEPVKKDLNWSTNDDARSLNHSTGSGPITVPRNGTVDLLFNREPNSAFSGNPTTSPSRNGFVNGSANSGSSRRSGTNLGPIREDRMQNATTDQDEFMWDEGEDLFSRNMGGPSISRFETADFDHDADDNDLLEAAENFENRRFTQEYRSHDRQVFSETSGNISRPLANKKNNPHPVTIDGARQYPWSNQVQAALTGRFRLRGFRHNQLEAINATLDGKDTFVLMPTGGGKSLCYQLPSIITSGRTRGVTLVVSPLLSLMEDQVSHLKRLNIRATLINGEVSAKDRREIFDTLQGPRGEEKIQLLYVTPEMVNKSNNIIKAFHNLHKNKKLARIVIDEAHCVSQWGHDFRPDYKMLGDVRTEFPGVPVMALTATATENVKTDIIHNLRIPDCQVFTQSFNRPNLTYEVLKKVKGANILASIAEKINTKYKRQSGIVYCLSRKACEGIAGKLRDEYGVNAAYYHAGMEPDERASVQKDWQCGKFHVIVATIAFGMGIDKPDVRFVIHHTMPKSLEGYYQETGRAGRDGKVSGCYLYYGFHDTSSLRNMINKSEGSEEQKQRQHQMLRNVVQFCENQCDCRRVQVLAYFNERFQRENCKRSCDNCKSDESFETRDFTQHAVLAMKLVKSLLREKAKIKNDDGDEKKKKYRLSLLYCVDLFRGANPKKLTDREIALLEGFAGGADLERGNTQRLFQRLLIEDALAEDNRVNGRGFALNYLTMGRRASEFASGRRPVKIQVHLSSKKPRQAPKKSHGTGVPAARDEYPESTNVSSPVQSLSRRRILRSRAQDLEATDSEEDEDSDGFPPIREQGKSVRNDPPDLGPPITNDAKLASLDFIQRIVLDYFLDKAKQECSRIMMEKGLRNQPFPDSILRDMGITFPQDMQQLLMIPNIDEDKVKRYGSKFLKLIQEAQSKYNEMKGQGVTEGPATSSRRVSNTISISSDEDYGDDDMGDFIHDQELNELAGDERSAYFEPEMPPPPGFSAQVSQFQADRSGSSRKSSSRGSRATSKGGQRGRRGGKGKGTGGNWKPKGARSSNGGSSSGRSIGSKRGGGSKSSSSSRTIGLMPT